MFFKKLKLNYFQLQLYHFIKITNKKEKGSGLVNQSRAFAPYATKGEIKMIARSKSAIIIAPTKIVPSHMLPQIWSTCCIFSSFLFIFSSLHTYSLPVCVSCLSVVGHTKTYNILIIP